MIYLKSDYSPEAAGELQEHENVMMVFAGLHCAGMSCDDLAEYQEHSATAAQRYEAALGEPDASGQHTQEQWDAANAASSEHLEHAKEVLVNAGITIENKLVRPDDPEHHFHHIATTIYSGAAAMEPVCCIERAIIDIEAETYVDNSIGWGAANVH